MHQKMTPNTHSPDHFGRLNQALRRNRVRSEAGTGIQLCETEEDVVVLLSKGSDCSVQHTRQLESIGAVLWAVCIADSRQNSVEMMLSGVGFCSNVIVGRQYELHCLPLRVRKDLIYSRVSGVAYTEVENACRRRR